MAGSEWLNEERYALLRECCPGYKRYHSMRTLEPKYVVSAKLNEYGWIDGVHATKVGALVEFAKVYFRLKDPNTLLLHVGAAWRVAYIVMKKERNPTAEQVDKFWRQYAQARDDEERFNCADSESTAHQ